MRTLVPRFSRTSESRLATCDKRLQDLLSEIVKDFDCTIIQGYRTPEQHMDYLRQGKTKVSYKRSKHSKNPSLAVDVVPYPIDWGDRERITYFAGHVMQKARDMGIPLRWGGDWDMDTDLKDNRFDDLVHFEILE